MHKISASFAVGLNCPFSIEQIVFLETPIKSAKFCCVRFFFFAYLFDVVFQYQIKHKISLLKTANNPINQKMAPAKYLFFFKDWNLNRHSKKKNMRPNPENKIFKGMERFWNSKAPENTSKFNKQ